MKDEELEGWRVEISPGVEGRRGEEKETGLRGKEGYPSLLAKRPVG